MKKIPYGESDYEYIIENDFLYVDKTMYIEKLENKGNKLIYLRPSRFGKSLFANMLRYYYDLKKSDKFESLFKGTYVYSHPTTKKNSYYILKFNFSGISAGLHKSIEELEDKFKVCVIQGITRFLSRYEINCVLDESMDADMYFKSFLTKFSALNLEHKIYVIIDEYDNFTNEILEGDASRFKSIVGRDGVLKSFYANIKLFMEEDPIIEKFFATGICPITLNSMTTGFNIATDLSIDKEFASMVGLTHEEVRVIFDEYGLTNEEKESIYQVMIDNYDGYLFSDELSGENRTFNATLVMYFMKEYLKEKEIPRRLYDNNIVVNYGKIDNLLKLQNNEFYKEIIEEILKNEEIVGSLKTQFNLEEDFTRNDIISLLYYFGYLTIKEAEYGSNVVFCIPNTCMKETYSNYFLKLLSDIDVRIDTVKLNNIIKEIVTESKIELLCNYVSETLQEIGSRSFIKFDEKYIEVMFYSFLKGIKEFSVYTEYECTGGFMDVFIRGNNPYMSADIIIELKYIKKGDYTENILNEKMSEGIDQLKKYSMDSRLKKDLKKYLVVFSGNDLIRLEIID